MSQVTSICKSHESDELNEYVKSMGIMLPNGQVFLEKPLFVFKKVYTYPDYKDKDYENAILVNPRTLNEYVKNCRNYFGVSNHAVANLIIPAGSIVNLSNYEKKFRSDAAICWNIVRRKDRKHVQFAYSKHIAINKYLPLLYLPAKETKNITLSDIKRNAKIYDWSNNELGNPYVIYNSSVTPETPFDKSTNTCRSGIHFFLEPETAVDY